MEPERSFRMSNFLLLLFFSLKVVSTSCTQVCDFEKNIPILERKSDGESNDIVDQAGLCKHLRSLVLIDLLTFSLRCHTRCSVGVRIGNPVTNANAMLTDKFNSRSMPLQPFLSRHVAGKVYANLYGCCIYYDSSDSMRNSCVLDCAMLDIDMQKRHCSMEPVCCVHERKKEKKKKRKEKNVPDTKMHNAICQRHQRDFTTLVCLYVDSTIRAG